MFCSLFFAIFWCSFRDLLLFFRGGGGGGGGRLDAWPSFAGISSISLKLRNFFGSLVFLVILQLMMYFINSPFPYDNLVPFHLFWTEIVLKTTEHEYIFWKYSRNLNIPEIFWSCYMKNNFPMIFPKYKNPYILTSIEI